MDHRHYHYEYRKPRYSNPTLYLLSYKHSLSSSVNHSLTFFGAKEDRPRQSSPPNSNNYNSAANSSQFAFNRQSSYGYPPSVNNQ